MASATFWKPTMLAPATVAQAIALGDLDGGVIDVLHDALQLGIDFLSGPVQTLSVLSHLQLGDGHAMRR